MTPTVNSSDFVILSFFLFFGFQPKATRAGDEKHRKKAHGLMPDLRRSPTRVKSTPWAGDTLLFYAGLQPLAHEG